MPVELLCCRCCGSDNLEVIEPGGLVQSMLEPGATDAEWKAVSKLLGKHQYKGMSVGQQFHCHDCGRFSDQCSVAESSAVINPKDIPVAQAIVASMRRQRGIDIAREEWGGLAY
jgi:hypothetical protein